MHCLAEQFGDDTSEGVASQWRVFTALWRVVSIQGGVPSPADALVPKSFTCDRLPAVDSRELEHDPVDMGLCSGLPFIFQRLGWDVSTTMWP